MSPSVGTIGVARTNARGEPCGGGERPGPSIRIRSAVSTVASSRTAPPDSSSTCSSSLPSSVRLSRRSRAPDSATSLLVTAWPGAVGHSASHTPVALGWRFANS